MRAILLTVAMTLAGTVSADEPRPVQRPEGPRRGDRPERPRVVQPQPERPAQPRLVIRLPELEEAIELLEVQHAIRKTHIRAAEIGVQKAELKRQATEMLVKQNGASEFDLAMAKLDQQAARIQVELRQGELREIEVKLKYARLRLENAKAARARPGQVRPADPLRERERQRTERKPTLEELTANAARSTELIERAERAVNMAEDHLEKLRAGAKAGRVQASALEEAEVALTNARKRLKAMQAEREARLAEIEVLRKKLEKQKK